MALPIPTDPDFVPPKPTEAEFNDMTAPEDEALLATGAFDDEPDDDELIDEEGSAQ